MEAQSFSPNFLQLHRYTCNINHCENKETICGCHFKEWLFGTEPNITITYVRTLCGDSYVYERVCCQDIPFTESRYAGMW